jgi:hypothetical protein
MKKRTPSALLIMQNPDKSVRFPDVGPLDKREFPLKTRKGMIRTNNRHHVVDGVQTENPIYDLVRAKHSS